MFNSHVKESRHINPGSRSDKSKEELISAPSKLAHPTMTKSPEMKGTQLKDRTTKHKDEFGPRVSKRGVDISRNKDVVHRRQKGLGQGPGEPEIHGNQSLLDMVESGSLC
ncbi:uncharacterized protein Z518_02379 [Rhinocladiella mackenziei CBS 650.93]|uniref:Uncharacterized protein n=1 Tax=Rhinocladiella mackenziei CBS 650.93 TaxID=1442369 RepID=A0A0D2JEV1_9EURO|nr:uncharacterized protein Z518_02379 [Rhinocladiella mackenziei CBS 650.93]KIX07725.1 hypothetical protein Z518_02379 [Rhinocladiella mackenziei CBS 650.93]